MLKFWVYVIFLVLLAAFGLTVGSANDTKVTFDFLFIKADVTVAFVLVIGIVFGLLMGLYISLLMCFRFWHQAHAAKAALKAYRKEVSKEQKEQTGADAS